MYKKIPFATHILLIFILLILLFQFPISQFQSSTVVNPIQELENLEPNKPMNLDDPPFFTLPFPENEVPITTVINYGNELPVEFIYSDPNWKRQSYKEYWHSSYFRWSYVPNRIHYAMHRIFATYPTASVDYDFSHNLGISEETLYFRDYASSAKSPYEFLEVVVMNTSIEKIYSFENQVVVIGKPQRQGLRAIIIPTKRIKPVGTSQEILIQLATSEGDEIDYTLISHISVQK